jgi:lipid II:glycine glycyltransferase (peptidoglycan interpeptide bridge formation enzyme)
LKIRLATKDGHLAAGILTIRSKSTMTYKYGCSDPRFHKFGSMQLLIWKAIQDAKENGLSEFDMGRTDWSNEGLLTFKDHWGGKRSTLLYFRHPAPKSQPSAVHVPMRIAKRIVALAPSSLLTAAGAMLYRHIA